MRGLSSDGKQHGIDLESPEDRRQGKEASRRARYVRTKTELACINTGDHMRRSNLLRGPRADHDYYSPVVYEQPVVHVAAALLLRRPFVVPMPVLQPHGVEVLAARQ